ncbi:pyridoxal phosphate-dependent aminotransferase [Actinomadura sp. B10D3]|uniref:pyridoxal phosphate-dependent aminotransferase n=1 Tax=Actinomadura sp. B10D3 TaxID=3153557 RepID=UPI00325DF3AF
MTAAGPGRTFAQPGPAAVSIEQTDGRRPKFGVRMPSMVNRLNSEARKVAPVAANLAAHEIVKQRQLAGLSTLPLAFGESGLPVHRALKTELAAAVGLNAYGSVDGEREFREAVAGYFRRRGVVAEPGQVVGGPGSKPLLFAIMLALGGDVVLPRPSWVSYAFQAQLCGVRPLFTAIRPGEGGVPDPEEMTAQVTRARREGRKVGSVILTIPDNPTSTLPRPELVADLCQAARELDLTIVSDEIYRDLVFDCDHEFPSPSRYAPERTVITTGLSKNLALGGWRVGVAFVPDPELRTRILGVASNIWSTSSNPIQRAATLAFREPPEIIEHVTASRRLHAEVVTAMAARLAEAGIPVPKPRAGFYLYPDLEPLRANMKTPTSADLARLLLEEHGVAVVPGSAFGEDPQALKVRMATSLLYGQDDAQREAALAAPAPTSLPWIAAALDRVTDVLGSLATSP